MIRWLKSLFCSHEYAWVRNLYGDHINWSGGMRSIWRCTKCEKYDYLPDLHPKSEEPT